jgi:tRNA-modifying protein YgfZ
MSSGRIGLVNDECLLRIEGSDSGTFLQELLTNDIALLNQQRAIFSGLLSPQGKLLFEFMVIKTEDGFFLHVASERLAALTEQLNKYKLRSKIAIERVSFDSSYTVWPYEAGENLHIKPLFPQTSVNSCRFPDPRYGSLGWRWFVDGNEGSAFWTHGGLERSDYDAHRISLGVPECGKDYLSGELFPHEAMFDQLNGVSFTKGCYVGQEIVSRMQHRGTARSRFLMVAGTAPLPERGTEVLAGDRPIGAMGSSVGGNGLALIRLDRLGDAYKEGKPITIGGMSITLTKPPYATFEVPPP